MALSNHTNPGMVSRRASPCAASPTALPQAQRPTCWRLTQAKRHIASSLNITPRTNTSITHQRRALRVANRPKSAMRAAPHMRERYHQYQ
jgi:hypothetical protein